MGVIDDRWSSLVSVVRLGRGSTVRHGGARHTPERPLDLYEFEACPYCRNVREALSELDLDYVCHPVAKGSSSRSDVAARSFPYLVDSSAGVSMGESADIIAYLHETYGAGRDRAARRFPVLDGLGSHLTSAIRPRGRRVRRPRRAQPPERPVLYQFEGCPYCRKVRERLGELDLVYVVRNVAMGSPRRADLRARGGKVQVPYFIDPNAGVEMYESDAILAYLDTTYG